MQVKLNCTMKQNKINRDMIEVYIEPAVAGGIWLVGCFNIDIASEFLGHHSKKMEALLNGNVISATINYDTKKVFKENENER